MRAKFSLFLLLAFIVLIMGCVSYAEQYVEAHPELAPEVRKAILAHKVIKGMTPAEVIAAWGRPDRKVWEPAANSNTRLYKRFVYVHRNSPVMRVGVGFGHYSGAVGYGMGVDTAVGGYASYAIVIFENNKVTNIQIVEN